MFIADPFANTCCNIELISDSSLDFTTLELNLPHPASKKERAVPMDKHWFHPLSLSGQWLVFDLLYYFFLLLPCQRCPKLKGPALCRALGCSSSSMRGGPQGQKLLPWWDPAGGGEGSVYIHKFYMNVAAPSVWRPLVFGNSTAVCWSHVIQPGDECCDVGKIECNCQDK